MTKLYRPKFCIITAEAIDDENLTDSARIYLGFLNVLANKYGYITAGDEELAELMETSVRTIERWNTALEQGNHIQRQTWKEHATSDNGKLEVRTRRRMYVTSKDTRSEDSKKVTDPPKMAGRSDPTKMAGRSDPTKMAGINSNHKSNPPKEEPEGGGGSQPRSSRSSQELENGIPQSAAPPLWLDSAVGSQRAHELMELARRSGVDLSLVRTEYLKRLDSGDPIKSDYGWLRWCISEGPAANAMAKQIESFFDNWGTSLHEKRLLSKSFATLYEKWPSDRQNRAVRALDGSVVPILTMDDLDAAKAIGKALWDEATRLIFEAHRKERPDLYPWE